MTTGVSSLRDLIWQDLSAGVSSSGLSGTRSLPSVLALDIASGGVSAALIDPHLQILKFHEIEWRFVGGPTQGTLSAAFVLDAVRSAIRAVTDKLNSPEALVLSSMMHTMIVSDGRGVPRTPIFTWFDRREERMRKQFEKGLGSDYSSRTGAYFHPSFPVWKLAALRSLFPHILGGPHKIGSAKSYVQAKLTGKWVEDISTASASGLLNLHSGEWDPLTLDVLELDRSALPALVRPSDLAGTLSREAAAWSGLTAGLPVVAGGGDGFLASLGSGCDLSERMAVTLGSTAGVRRFSQTPETAPELGTFCYRYAQDVFLVGCASNNGGNVLEWARAALGPLDYSQTTDHEGPPLFLPFLYGERSPFWDPERRPQFVGLTGRHTVEDLVRAVVEGVAFHLGVYSELVASRLKDRPSMVVLSGNGFQLPILASLLGAVTALEVLEPVSPGLATLRGTARCGFQALGVSTTDSIEALIQRARRVQPQDDRGLLDRFDRFKGYYVTGR